MASGILEATLIDGRRVLRFVALASIAAGIPLVEWIASMLIARGPTFNDFHSYWLAGRLVLDGRSPYDLEAMRSLAQAEGLAFVLGTGYSYPLPFAILMIPFALLPFTSAVLVFSAISLVAFGWLVAWWLARHHPDASDARLVVGAALAGLFPPVFGTIANGQANLIVLVPLTVGLAWTSRSGRSSRAGGGLLGLAAVVKIVPAVTIVPLLLARRWSAVASLVVVGVTALLVASVLAPNGQLGTVGLWRLLGPDPYVTNQSINGFVSRIVLESDWTLPLAASAFDPAAVAAVATIAFGLVTLLILLPSRRVSSSFPALALGLAVALVAATIGAPKNSFWNQALALPAVGLLLAVEAPELHLGRFRRLDRLLLLACGIGSGIQSLTWLLPLPKFGPLAAVTTVAESAALFGMLALWGLLVRRFRGLVRDFPRRPVPAG